MFTNEFSHKATTISLSILVVVEMFNAMNSLSENESLLTFPLYKNLYLCLAIILSMILHLMILYVPFFTVSIYLYIMHTCSTRLAFIFNHVSQSRGVDCRYHHFVPSHFTRRDIKMGQSQLCGSVEKEDRIEPFLGTGL